MPGRKQIKDEVQRDSFLNFVDKIIGFYFKQKIKIFITAGIIALLILGTISAVLFSQAKKKQISFKIAQAKTITEYEQIIASNPGNKAAARAYFLVATKYYAQEEYEKARQYYQEFIKNFPNHFLVPYLYIDLGYCYENLNNSDAALQTYLTVETNFPESSAALQGKINAARCLLKQGDSERAKTLYEEVVSKAPFSLWAKEAEGALQEMELTN